MLKRIVETPAMNMMLNSTELTNPASTLSQRKSAIDARNVSTIMPAALTRMRWRLLRNAEAADAST